MATSIQNSSSPVFAGKFCHKIEGKNRITIPSPWRFGEEVQLFMIPKSLKRCVAVFTQSQLDRLMAEADTLEPEDRANFLDTIGSDMCQVTLDKAGRISIPEEFFPLLNLPENREVWLTGSVLTFNIWSSAEYATEAARASTHNESVKRRLGI